MTYQISEETANLINSSVNIDGTLDEKIRAAFDDLMHAQELGETTLQLVDAYNKTVEDSKKELEEKRRMYGAITAAAIDELQNAYNQPQSSPFPVNNITNKIKQADEGFTRALSDFSNNVNSKLYQANEHFAQISNKIKIAIQSKSKQSVDTSQFDPVCQYFKCTIQEIPNIMGKLYQANQNFESFVKQLSEKLHCTYDEVPNTLNQKLTIFESLLQTLNTEEPNAKNKLETTTSVINQLTTMFNTNETDLIPTISNLISEKQNNNNETNEAQLKQLKTSAIQLQKERDELQQQLQIITNQLQHNRNNITYQRFDHLIDIIPLNINMNIENAPNKDETIWKLQNELNKLLESLNTIQETKNNQIKSLTNQLEQTELNKISAETEKQNLEIEMQKLKMQISNNNYKNVIDNLMYTLNCTNENELIQKINDLKTEIMILKAGNTTNSNANENEQIKKSFEQLSDEFSKLQNETIKMNTELNTLLTQKKQFEKQIKNYKNQIESQNEMLSNEKAKTIELQQSNEMIKSDLEIAQQKILNLQENINSYVNLSNQFSEKLNHFSMKNNSNSKIVNSLSNIFTQFSFGIFSNQNFDEFINLISKIENKPVLNTNYINSVHRNLTRIESIFGDFLSRVLNYVAAIQNSMTSLNEKIFDVFDQNREMKEQINEMLNDDLAPRLSFYMERLKGAEEEIRALRAEMNGRRRGQSFDGYSPSTEEVFENIIQSRFT